jgi:hypothetical protein
MAVVGTTDGTLYAHAHIHTHKHTRARAHTHTHACVRTHTHTYTHTYTHHTRCGCAAGMAVVGTTDGTLYAHTARDPLQVGKHQAHTSSITAMVS